MGRLIPAGTGFEYCRHVRIPVDEPQPPPVLPEPSEEDLDHKMPGEPRRLSQPVEAGWLIHAKNCR